MDQTFNQGHYRPDRDLMLSHGEADYWYRNGKGAALNVNAKNIDFSEFTIDDFKDGKGNPITTRSIQTLFKSHQGRIYGNITVNLIDRKSGLITINDDTYDFEMHSIYEPVRNFGTLVGHARTGRGTPYNIHFYGFGQLGRK